MLIPRHALPMAAIAACLAASACGPSKDRQEEGANAANAVELPDVPKLQIPAPEPPLDRQRLLLAAIRAASDFVAGTDDSERQKALADKKFEFRIRFGCSGPSGSASLPPLGWTLNEKTGALKVQATPALSRKDPPVARLAGESFEAVEGFWVRQPWLLDAVCPRVAERPPQPTEAAAATAGTPQGKPDGKGAVPAGATGAGPAGATGGEQPPEQLVGIAQFFTATGPRTLRRSGRPYQATKRLDRDDLPKSGFDLVLSGRLVPLPDGRVIACTGSPADGRPACIISVEFGKVSIERADTHEQLALWGSG